MKDSSLSTLQHKKDRRGLLALMGAGSFFKVVPLGFTLANRSLVVATLQNRAAVAERR